VVLETAITLWHAHCGATVYEDPSRLHMVRPALVCLLCATAAIAVFVWRPRTETTFVVVAIVGVPYLAILGAFHGGYSHLAKDVAFLMGASRETLAQFFMSPDFAFPDSVMFEATGFLTLGASLFVGRSLLDVVREARRFGVVAAPKSIEPEDPPPPDLEIAETGVGVTGLFDLARSMLLDSPLKSLGTLIGVVVSVFLMAQQSSLLLGILGRVTSFVNSSGVDLWVMSSATESTDATDTIPASRVGSAASTPGVAWAAPVVQGIGKVTRPDGVREFVKVLGVEGPRYAGLPRTLAPGTTPESLHASSRILINWNDRPTFASAVPGDRIEIDGRAGVVAGFFQGMDPHSPYYYIFANIDDARSFTDFPQDRITFVAVGLKPGETASAVKARLQTRMPEAIVKSREEFSGMERRYFLVRTPVGLVFGMGSVFAALIGMAIVAVTLYSTAVDRSRDYGTVKAIGARRRDILQLLLVQSWIFAIVGYAIGLGIFFLVRLSFTQLPMVASPQALAGVGVASLVSCTLASVAAIRRVLSLDPAIVFRT
jgi:putative ABC transport system permease protein